MGGFNYGGGQGDGTSWSSERGNGPAPGGGSKGNSGNREIGGSISSGKSGSFVGSSVLTKELGAKMARSLGLSTKDFASYIIREDGHVLGITTYSLGDAYGVDLGLATPSSTANGTISVLNGTPNAPSTYNGDISDARVATLKKIIIGLGVLTALISCLINDALINRINAKLGL